VHPPAPVPTGSRASNAIWSLSGPISAAAVLFAGAGSPPLFIPVSLTQSGRAVSINLDVKEEATFLSHRWIRVFELNRQGVRTCWDRCESSGSAGTDGEAEGDFKLGNGLELGFPLTPVGLRG